MKVSDQIFVAPGALNGIIEMPPSKSLSHRAIIAAALSSGPCCIDNLIYSQDIDATLSAVALLGAIVEKGEAYVNIHGMEKNINCSTLKAEANKDNSAQELKVIQCSESGSTLRFMIPIATAIHSNVCFMGQGRLVKRPIDAFFSVFDQSGMTWLYENELPLRTSGCLKSGRFLVEGNVSSQFITGLLMAAPLLDGLTEIVIVGELESKAYVELTLDVLKAFNISYEREAYHSFTIKGRQSYSVRDYRVEGDYSQSVFWLVGAVLGGQLSLKGLNLNSTQGDAAVRTVIELMGGKLHVDGDCLVAYKSVTHGVRIDASEIPDLIPALAVLAAFSQGETTIYNGERLRIKESDRISSTVDILTRLGADVRETTDGMVIIGKEHLEGGCTVHGHGDHRIVMAAAIAATRCKNPVTIEGCSAVRKSYPHFFEELKRLGGKLVEVKTTIDK